MGLMTTMEAVGRLEDMVRHATRSGRMPVMQTDMSDRPVTVGTVPRTYTGATRVEFSVPHVPVLNKGRMPVTMHAPRVDSLVVPVRVMHEQVSLDPRMDSEAAAHWLERTIRRYYCGSSTALRRMDDEVMGMVNLRLTWVALEPMTVDDMETLFDLEDFDPVDHEPIS